MRNSRALIALIALAIAACATTDTRTTDTRTTAANTGTYKVDALWPKPLPNQWLFGQVAGIAVDANDHIWVIHRPASLLADEKRATSKPPGAKCCFPAPAVIEFDANGNVLQSWGGPGQGYEWPKNEHGIHVDNDGNVWIAGNDAADHQVLKFTRDGKFLMQIGKAGKSEGSNSTAQLGRPAHMDTDLPAGEIYIADGYGNRRIVVFDVKTGAYKRHWGAYGGVPNDDKLPAYEPNASGSESFQNPVHCARIARDNLLYVCDRGNDRIQVFQKDGTFVKEFFVERQTLGSGSTFEIAFSPDRAQTYLFVADGTNNEIHVVQRADGKRVGGFGRLGPMAGEFKLLHNIASDSKGNLYTGEAGTGRRIQKFVRSE